MGPERGAERIKFTGAWSGAEQIFFESPERGAERNFLPSHSTDLDQINDDRHPRVLCPEIKLKI